MSFTKICISGVLIFVILLISFPFSYAATNDSVRMRITNGTVMEIKENSLKVKSDDIIYTVLTDKFTRFRREYWGDSSREDISLNDKVNIRANKESRDEKILHALFIRDLSIEQKPGVFFGKLIQKDKTYLLKSKKWGDLLVEIPPDMKVVIKHQTTLPITSLKSGDFVRIKAVWDKKEKKLIKVKEIKNFSSF